VKDKVIRSIRDYLDIIESIASVYATHIMKSDLIFRGLSSYNHMLIPGVYRAIAGESAQGPTSHPSYGEATEYEILRHFIKNAMSIVDHIDKDDLLTWLTYAQHFGAPTRLLDFSSNPLISLYFSCKREPELDGGICIVHERNYVHSLHLNAKNQTKRDVLNEILDNVIDSSHPCTPYPVVFIPHYIDNRMEAQASRFLVWGNDKTAFESIADRHGSMLEEESRAFFCKIRVDASCKRSLLRELSFLGVNEKKLFPGLDGIGKYISEYYRRTEQDYIE